MLNKYLQPLAVFLLAGLSVTTACKKEYFYEYAVNEQTILPATAGKDKLKTAEQYAAILHVNLFQRALSSNDIYDISRVILSIGDKKVANDVLFSNFMNKPGVVLPSKTDMHANPESFITAVYERFFLRIPTELEKEWFRKYIQTHPNLTPEMVYYSFAMSNEYQFY